MLSTDYTTLTIEGDIIDGVVSHDSTIAFDVVEFQVITDAEQGIPGPRGIPGPVGPIGDVTPQVTALVTQAQGAATSTAAARDQAALAATAAGDSATAAQGSVDLIVSRTLTMATNLIATQTIIASHIAFK